MSRSDLFSSTEPCARPRGPAAPGPSAVGLRTPFNGVEESWQLRNPPDETANIQLEVRVSGSLDEARLRGAIRAALAAHPMARARRAAGRRLLRPPVWEIGEPEVGDILGAIECRDGEGMAAARVAFYDRTIDLGRSPTVRFLLARRPWGDSLLMNAHHANTDGVGALRFLHSVARAYDDRPDPAPALDPVAAREAGAFFKHQEPKQPREAGPAGLPAGSRAFIAPEGECRGPGYGFHLMALTEEQCRGLNPRRFEPTATVNDLLMAALHRTIARWNECRGRQCDSIAVFMPANARPSGWRNDIVANFTGGSKVASTPEQRATVEALMAALVKQTRWIKDGGPTAMVRDLPIWALNLAGILWPIISSMLGERVENTAVLSNLGRLEDLPDFGADAGTVTEFWFSPPCGMPMGLALGVTGLRGRLHLAFRYRRALFDDGAAGNFADLFLATLFHLGHDGP